MDTNKVVNIEDYQSKKVTICDWDIISEKISKTINEQNLSKKEVILKLNKILNKSL